jgi:mono/diheme cytochrome c family protein
MLKAARILPAMRTALVVLLFTTSLHSGEGPAQLDIGEYLQGRHLFEQQCSPCHGANGRGDGEWSKDVTDKPRNFRTGTFKFRTTPPGFLPTSADLERTVRNGISGTMMPAFTDLRDQNLKAVLSYVRTLSSRWKDAANYHEPVLLPDLPDWFEDRDSINSHAANAAPLFQAMCATCHGTSGRGDGPAATSLIDVWKHPIKPADFSKPHRKSGSNPQDLYRSIALGLDGTPMTAYRDLLPPETIWSLVAYIQSLSAPPSQP